MKGQMKEALRELLCELVVY